MRRVAMVTALTCSLVGCGFVRDVVRDPVGTAFDVTESILEAVIPYVIDGGLTALVLALKVLDGDLDYGGQPVWICYASCDDADEDSIPDDAVGHLDCVNCSRAGDALHFATNEATIVLPADGWWLEEFETEGPFGASFETAGETSWTRTDGERRVEQPVVVSDAVDVAVFDLTGGNVEIGGLELAVGESREMEILPVDAEGNVLAAIYEEVAIDGGIAESQRAGFASVEGWETTGTVARVTGTASGETAMTVRVAGLERTLPLSVR